MKPDSEQQSRRKPARASAQAAPGKTAKRASAQTPYQQRAAIARQDVLLLLQIGVFILPLVGMLSLAFGRGVLWPMAWYLLASVVTFFLYRHDKQRARDKGWRVPERVLHLGELLGGWPGALIAQQRFRHKTVKLSFRLVFFAIVALHQLLWLDVLCGGVLYRQLPLF
ncbi:cold-shock protein [Pseudomonas oryzihabitans]|nr:cold-shock protein [Pseudomonas psychrotolerans]